MPRRAVVTAVLVAVCGCQSVRPGSEPLASLSNPTAPPATDDKATFYGRPAVRLPAQAETAVFERIAALTGLSCTLEPLLGSVARDHAEDLAVQGARARSSDLDRLRFMVHRRGGVDYWLMPFYSTADEAGIADLAAKVAKAHVQRFGHCGLGVSTGQWPMAVLLLSDRALELEPLTISPDPWSSLDVRGRLRPGVRLGGAYVGLPGGGVRRLVPRQGQGSDFAVRLSLSGPGRYDLELSVDLGRGEETALLVPLYAGVLPEERPTVVPDEAETARVSPETLLGYINATRERAGIVPISLSSSLNKLARKHSEEMAKSRFFGHVSPTAGDLLSRLAVAGLSPGKYAENVARSRTLIRLHNNLKASPSHRMHLLDPEYTHVGIGIASSGEDLVVTEIFAKF